MLKIIFCRRIRDDPKIMELIDPVHIPPETYRNGECKCVRPHFPEPPDEQVNAYFGNQLQIRKNASQRIHFSYLKQTTDYERKDRFVIFSIQKKFAQKRFEPRASFLFIFPI